MYCMYTKFPPVIIISDRIHICDALHRQVLRRLMNELKEQIEFLGGHPKLLTLIEKLDAQLDKEVEISQQTTAHGSVGAGVGVGFNVSSLPPLDGNDVQSSLNFVAKLGFFNSNNSLIGSINTNSDAGAIAGASAGDGTSSSKSSSIGVEGHANALGATSATSIEDDSNDENISTL